jgi:hypothetical protein
LELVELDLAVDSDSARRVAGQEKTERGERVCSPNGEMVQLEISEHGKVFAAGEAFADERIAGEGMRNISSSVMVRLGRRETLFNRYHTRPDTLSADFWL